MGLFCQIEKKTLYTDNYQVQLSLHCDAKHEETVLAKCRTYVGAGFCAGRKKKKNGDKHGRALNKNYTKTETGAIKQRECWQGLATVVSRLPRYLLERL